MGRLRSRSLVFNLGFADKHNGDAITYRVYAVTLTALQAIPVMDHFHGCLTERADKNLQQLWINRHGGNGSTGTPRSIPWGWSNQESEISKLDGFLHLKSESGNLKLDPWFEIRSQAPEPELASGFGPRTCV